MFSCEWKYVLQIKVVGGAKGNGCWSVTTTYVDCACVNHHHKDNSNNSNNRNKCCLSNMIESTHASLITSRYLHNALSELKLTYEEDQDMRGVGGPMDTIHLTTAHTYIHT